LVSTKLNKSELTNVDSAQADPLISQPAETYAEPLCTTTELTESEEDDKSGEWKKSRHELRKSRSKSKFKSKSAVLVGVGKDDNTLQSAERVRYIQAWNFQPDTTSEQITTFLNKIYKSEEYTVEKRDIKTKRHASFIIGFPESIYERLNSPASWPHGIRFTDWFRVRPRAERGPTTDRRTAAAQ
jgi:hypothetical protein